MKVTEVTNTGLGERIIARCREIAACTDVAGEITRTFLSPATHNAHGEHDGQPFSMWNCLT